MNSLIAIATVSYLLVGHAAYSKIIIPRTYREALDGDEDAMLSLIHRNEKSLVHYLTYGGWLLFYPAFFALGWIIARLDIDF